MTITIEPNLWGARIDGELVPIPRREFEMLLKLAAEPRRVWTPSELSPTARDAKHANMATKVVVMRIREALGTDAIENRYNVGYVLADHVEMAVRDAQRR